MTPFKRGQKSKLDALTSSRVFKVRLRLTKPPSSDIDISCFGLDADGKLSDERYFVFYNQVASPCAGIRLLTQEQAFDIDLDKLPSTIHKLVFAATIDGADTMAALGSSELELQVGSSSVMSFAFDGKIFSQEKAVMIGEVYRKGVWRIAAVGQGFAGGLQALLESFGGEAAGASPDPPQPTRRAQPSPPPRPVQASPPSPAPTPAPPPRVNLGKVTLEKRGQSQRVSLVKGGHRDAESIIHVNLNWDAGAKRGWLGPSRGAAVDLDLGCMWEMDDGIKGVIQPLGNGFGARHEPPYILLDKDDRSGMAADGENMRLYRPDRIRRALIFALIYEGSANFTEVNGRVTIKDQQGSEILVRMDAPDNRRTFCAVCLLERVSDGIRISKEERYFFDHRECDLFYGFGFRWTAGRK